jgi:CBS domain-containing protein
MSPKVHTVAADTPVATAAATMVRKRCGSVAIVTGETLVGIFTERDVLRAAAEAPNLATVAVSEWMTPDPVTATPDTDSEEAAATMLAQGFRHLPVLDGGGLVGIVSLRDLFSTRIAGR